jgi:site-specific recombinase XerD
VITEIAGRSTIPHDVAGSRVVNRWLEAGWPIHHVQEMLGHSHLSQTSTCLHATQMGLHESMRRFDAAPPSKGLLH